MKQVVVTGAFSYTGAAVARELLARGHGVVTLTHRQPPPGSTLRAEPLEFDVDRLVSQLHGADTLVNTFWVRIPYGGQSFESAVSRSRILIEAAARANVRVVHVSVSNASLGRNLGYYRGKAEVEDVIRQADIPYAIVRPTLIVGPCDVLSNNIAWFLRRFGTFLVPDGGRCRLQPVTLGDVGKIVADQVESNTNAEVDAAGPEIFTFMEYVRLLARASKVRALILPAPSGLVMAGMGILDRLLDDVVLTREEWLGLAQELLVSHEPPLGGSLVSQWLLDHGPALGRNYVNDVTRHFKAGARMAILDPTA